MAEIKPNILSKIQRLESFYGTYRSKCRRNLRLYEYSPLINIDSLTDEAVVGYYQAGTFDINDPDIRYQLVEEDSQHQKVSLVESLQNSVWVNKKIKKAFLFQEGLYFCFTEP